MIKKIFLRIKEINASWKLKALASYFENKEKILDFGCGDLTLAKSLKKKCPQLEITGVDVVPVKYKPRNISFVRYDGKSLPFKNNSFDTVVSFYVFHHCVDARAAFKECLRVTKRRIIFVEAVATYGFEIYLMSLLDWLYNLWKREPVPLTHQFFFLDQWMYVFKKYRLKIGANYEINKTIASFLPIGKTYIFEIYKN